MECTELPDCSTHRGYPITWVKGKRVKIHVLNYEARFGPIPEGYVLHHTCGNRRCVEAEHGQPLTRSEHQLIHSTDGDRCRKGHPLTPQKDGKRKCMVCHRNRVRAWRARSSVLATLVAAALLFSSPSSASPSNEAVIRAVFGPYGSQAVRVAWCESRLTTWARNGQYLGLFQMGTYARAKYGHGSDPWTQARAAYRYFVDSGKGWGPWSCKPW